MNILLKNMVLSNKYQKALLQSRKTILVDSGNLVQFRAVGKDVKVSGAGNFTIKNIHVDLDTLTIRARVRFPKLHFDGKYTMDARLLVIPLTGQGNIVADAVAVVTGSLKWQVEFVVRVGDLDICTYLDLPVVYDTFPVKCDAEIVVRSRFVEKDGVDYIQFASMDMDINVKDYRVQLDGLFNGDKALGAAANEAINQNRAEFLRGSKPYVERTCSKLLLDIANKIASTFPIDDLLPMP